MLVEDNCRDRWVRLRAITSVSTYALHATSSIKHAVGTRNNPNQKCAELRTIAACKKQKWQAYLILFFQEKRSRYNLIKAKHSLTQKQQTVLNSVTVKRVPRKDVKGPDGTSSSPWSPALVSLFYEVLEAPFQSEYCPKSLPWEMGAARLLWNKPLPSRLLSSTLLNHQLMVLHCSFIMEPISWSKAQWFSILRRGGCTDYTGFAFKELKIMWYTHTPTHTQLCDAIYMTQWNVYIMIIFCGALEESY